MKNLTKKSEDEIYTGLLAYRATPLSCGKSPAEILYNRKLRTYLPILEDQKNKRITITELHLNYQIYKETWWG